MRQTNPPFCSPALDEALAEKLKRMDVVMREAVHAIRDIAAVGALLNIRGEIQPSDLDIVANVCDEFAKAGIPIHPQPRLQVYNLLPPAGSDFLQTGLAARYGIDDMPPRPAADLVVLCYVFSGSARAAGYHLLHPAQREGFEEFRDLYNDVYKYRLNRLTAVSPEQDEPGLWAESAYESGAKFVATYGGDCDEVCSRHFAAAARFTPLIETKENYRKGFIGYSSGSFGFLVREGYREQLAGVAKPANLLGKRLG